MLQTISQIEKPDKKLKSKKSTSLLGKANYDFILDMNGCITFVSGVLATEWGISNSELIHKYLFTDIFGKDEEEFLNLKKKLEASGQFNQQFKFENSIVNGLKDLYLKFEKVELVGNNLFFIGVKRKAPSQEVFSKNFLQQEVLNLLPLGVLITSAQAPFEPKTLNQHLLGILGNSHKEILREWKVYKNTLGGKAYWNAIKQFVKQTETNNTELSLAISLNNGEFLYCQSSIHKVKKGSHTLLIHTFQDITPTRQVEQKLETYQKLYKDASEAGKIGSWEYDIRSHQFSWSEEVFNILKIPHEGHQPSPKLFYEHVHQDDLDEIVAEVETCVRSRKSFRINFRIINEEEQVFHVSSRGNLEYDFKEKSSKLVGTIQDVTELEDLQFELKTVKDKHSYIKHLAKIGTCEWDLATNMVSYSEEFADIHDLPSKKKGKISLDDLLDLAHPIDKKNLTEIVEGYQKGNSGKPFYYTIITPQQKVKHIFTQFKIVEYSNDQPTRVTGIVHDISERKEIQNELKYYEHLHQNVNDAIISTNHLLEIKSWNKAAEEIYGWKHSEVIGKKIKDVLDNEENSHVYNNLFKYGQWTGQTKHYNKAGEELIIQSSAKLLQSSSNNALGIVTVNRDITDFVKVEQQVYASQQMLELIFENIPGWIFWTDRDLDFMGCNRAFGEVIGKQSKKISGLTFKEIELFQENYKAIASNITSVIESKQSINNHILPLYVQKELKFWIEINHVPLKDLSGNVIGVLSTAEDITNRKLIEEELKEKQANLVAIIENTDDFICYLDTSLELKAFNTSFNAIHNELFQCTPLIGEKYLDLLPYEMRVQLDEIFNYVLTNKKLTTEREILIDNDYKWFEFSCNPVINENQTTGICFVFRDITKRKINEKLLLESKLQQEKIRSLALIQGQEEERQRVSMELHDGVGQILTALQMQANYLQGKKDDQDYEALSKNLHKISELVSGAKQEIRRISFNLMPSMLNDFGLEDSIEQLSNTMFEDSQIRTSLHLDVNNKRFDKRIEIGLFRVAQEIINNILKHSQAETVTIRLSADDSNLYFSINDDGVGFDLSKKQNNRRKGSGLGNIAQRINLLNGVLNIKAVPNQGCNFSVMIPLLKEVDS